MDDSNNFATLTLDGQEIQRAVALLQSLGVVRGLCISQQEEDDNFGTKVAAAATIALLQDLLPFCSNVAQDITASLPYDEHDQHHPESVRFYVLNTIGVLLNLLTLAILAGLYLGLLTLDVLDLQILERTSRDEDEVRHVRTILPIVKERHLLLVTIILCNTLAFEVLPILLARLVPEWGAILLSCTLIMLFGEIVPTGLFTGPNQLYLAYIMAPTVKFFMWFMSPIAKPIARLLDYFTAEGEGGGSNVGDDEYNRVELSALIRIQHERRMKMVQRHAHNQGHKIATRSTFVEEVAAIKYQRFKDRQWTDFKEEINAAAAEISAAAAEEGDEAMEIPETAPLPLHPTEVNLVEGALSLGTKHVMDIYTPLRLIYCLPDDFILDKVSVADIFSNGFSRIPIYHHSSKTDPHNTDEHGDDEKARVMGFLVTRNLMLIDWDDRREIGTIYLQRPSCVSPRANLVRVLQVLQKEGPQMVFVCARPEIANKALEAEKPIPLEAGFMGIVTLVDVMESILQDRIYDEEDIKERDRAVMTLTRWAATKLQKFVKREMRKRRYSRSLSPTGDRKRERRRDMSASVSALTSSSHENGTVASAPVATAPPRTAYAGNYLDLAGWAAHRMTRMKPATTTLLPPVQVIQPPNEMMPLLRRSASLPHETSDALDPIL